jgi:hypothetical protein
MIRDRGFKSFGLGDFVSLLLLVALIYGFERRSHKWFEGQLAFVDIKSGSLHQHFASKDLDYLD